MDKTLVKQLYEKYPDLDPNDIDQTIEDFFKTLKQVLSNPIEFPQGFKFRNILTVTPVVFRLKKRIFTLNRKENPNIRDTLRLKIATHIKKIKDDKKTTIKKTIKHNE